MAPAVPRSRRRVSNARAECGERLPVSGLVAIVVVVEVPGHGFAEVSLRQAAGEGRDDVALDRGANRRGWRGTPRRLRSIPPIPSGSSRRCAVVMPANVAPGRTDT